MRTYALTAEANGLLDKLPVQVQIRAKDAKSNPKTIEGVWDTGASMTVISQRVVTDLSLSCIDRQPQHTANREREAGVYLVEIILPNRVRFQALRVMDGELVQGVDILIGMDIISQGDFAVTNHQGKTFLSFQIPSRRRIDFVKEIDDQSRRQQQASAKIKSGNRRRKKR